MIALPEIPEREKDLLDFNLGKVDDFMRKISFQKPWVKMLMLGIPSYFAGKAITPKLVGLLSPHLSKAGIDFGTFDYMEPKDQKFIKRLVGGSMALAAMTPTVLSNIDFTGEKRHFGLSDFAPKQMDKQANIGFNPGYPVNAILLSTARSSIMDNPHLTPMTKATSCAILNTFPPQQNITGGDIINRAVQTGISGATNFAIGAVTAHALGLPNPYTTALITTGISQLI